MNLLPYSLVLLLTAADPPSVKTDAHRANPILQELLNQGVPLGAGKRMALPAPYMADGLSGDDQVKAIKALCIGPDPKKPLFDYRDSIERSSSSPYSFEDRRIKDSDPNAPAYMTTIWFVAYGDLSKIVKRDPLQLFGTSSSDAVTTVLDMDALEDRRIGRKVKKPLRERYVNTVAELLDTVKLSLTSHVVISDSGESLVVASKVDPRFTKDKEYPNYWQMLPQGLEANPKATKGPHPLEAGAFYLKITRLREPEGALFVESRQVATEPKAWFNGAPILRGKLPLWADKRVKDFRIMSLKTAAKP
jgi:hypothetical protein